MKRRKMILGSISPLATGLLIHSAIRAPRTAAAVQAPILSTTGVYFKSSATKTFRKIVVRIDISGTNHTIMLGEATCGGETFSLNTSTQVKDTVADKTYVSAVYAPKTMPAGDSPMKSGASAAISVSITIDNNTKTPSTTGPVIDVDPCAVK